MTLAWSLTDRMNRIWMSFCLVLASAGMIPFLLDRMSVLMMVAVGLLLVQAWHHSRMRTVTVTLDPVGITKQLAHRTWVVRWADVVSARLVTCWGSTQLVIRTAEPLAGWSFSDRPLGRLPRGTRAAQVDPGQGDQVRAIFAREGVALA